LLSSASMETGMNWCALACVSLVALAANSAEAQTVRSSAGNLTVETVARGLRHPWGLAFLPDGRMLVTERPGQMRIVTRDGKLSQPLAGVPRVFASGQGGLLDVALDRDFVRNNTIYFCLAEPATGGARTSMARAQLADDKLDGVRVIFRQEGPLSSGNHFGCRVVQMPDGNLFLTTGDHFTYRDEAQNLANHLGKTIRIRPDGSVPPDNPFVNRQGAKPEIWSYGHRNMQGAALQPGSNRYWSHEHGARGGDEVNIPQAGKNYGWPVITHGVDYSGAKIGIGTRKDGMEQPVWQWTPSIAPSGMAFSPGDLFPAWRGHLFVGALAGKMLVRLEVDGEKIGKEERLLTELGERIRDVRSGPDGALWLLTDSPSGRILRIAPAR
jgi:aldose sugar dehydrogenase